MPRSLELRKVKRILKKYGIIYVTGKGRHPKSLKSIYIEISQRIRGECQDLERVVQRVLHAWPQAQKMVDEQDVYLDSVALNLHSFYYGRIIQINRA